MFLPVSICLIAQPPVSVPTAPLSELIRAELAFAEMALRQGTRAAFLANLHPQAVVFSPGPVNGKGLWEAKPESPGLLSWFPAFAEVSEDGLMGYTTGPAEYRKERSSRQEAPAWKGRFLSVWRRDADGRWRVIFDAGDDQPCAEPSLTPEGSARPALPQGMTRQREGVLLERDRPLLPSSGDLAYVIESQEGFGPAGPTEGKAAVRIWKKLAGAWRLRAMVER